jgi:protein phosphatase
VHLPADALVVLVGPAGCGKSTFASHRFAPTQIVSSDGCRALVSDAEDDPRASRDAFALMHFIVDKRLKRGRLTVADATNVMPEKRRELRGHITETGEVITIESLRRDRAGDDDEGPRVA